MDADSLRSRFRVLVPIYLGPIHVLACAWWAVGTWQLPDFWSPAFRPATPGSPAAFTISSWSGHSVVAPFDARAYGHELARHWVGLFPGARASAHTGSAVTRASLSVCRTIENGTEHAPCLCAGMATCSKTKCLLPEAACGGCAAYGLPNVYRDATIWEQYLVSVYWCARFLRTGHCSVMTYMQLPAASARVPARSGVASLTRLSPWTACVRTYQASAVSRRQPVRHGCCCAKTCMYAFALYPPPCRVALQCIAPIQSFCGARACVPCGARHKCAKGPIAAAARAGA